jgi:queuosine precursor transporter
MFDANAMRAVGLGAFTAFIASIAAAVWLGEHVGVVDIGFGLEAPAAVYIVGLAFTFRDVVQRTLGVGWTVAAIVIGGALAYTVSPGFALASAAAFLFSEAIDLAVYTPIERHSWLGAVALSNTAGVVVDSMLYLALVFGSQELLAGQVVGKLWMTLLALPVLAAIRPRLQPALTR